MQSVFPKESFKADTVIIREGDAPGAVYIIRHGRVRVIKGGSQLAEIGPDGIFGDMALIDNSPRSATVIALEDTECFVVSVEEYHQLLTSVDPLLQAIVRIMTERLRQITSIYYF